MKIGIISDTHGLLRPEALSALAGSDHILHAGDVGKIEILDQLADIAPVTAIRGNIDKGPLWADRLNATEAVQVGEHWFYLVHSIDDLDIDPKAAGMNAIIFGHSHKPTLYWKDDVLFLNPGSAGPRRFSLPVTVATLDLSNGISEPEILGIV